MLLWTINLDLSKFVLEKFMYFLKDPFSIKVQLGKLKHWRGKHCAYVLVIHTFWGGTKTKIKGKSSSLIQGYITSTTGLFGASPVTQMVKNLPAMWETWNRSLCWEDAPEKGMATHSSILAWRITWTEEPDRLYSPWGCKESDTTEWLTLPLGVYKA